MPTRFNAEIVNILMPTSTLNKGILLVTDHFYYNFHHCRIPNENILRNVETS